MGTHPIFESDFDCLTECRSICPQLPASSPSTASFWTTLSPPDGYLPKLMLPFSRRSLPLLTPNSKTSWDGGTILTLTAPSSLLSQPEPLLPPKKKTMTLTFSEVTMKRTKKPRESRLSASPRTTPENPQRKKRKEKLSPNRTSSSTLSLGMTRPRSKRWKNQSDQSPWMVFFGEPQNSSQSVTESKSCGSRVSSKTTKSQWTILKSKSSASKTTCSRWTSLPSTKSKHRSVFTPNIL